MYVITKVHYTVVESSDPNVLDWLFEEVKKYIEDCTIKESKHDLSGNKYFIEIGVNRRKHQDADSQIDYYLKRLLLQDGWEPFQIFHEYGTTFWFRKEVP